MLVDFYDSYRNAIDFGKTTSFEGKILAIRSSKFYANAFSIHSL
jgi:hypothetical protein